MLRVWPIRTTEEIASDLGVNPDDWGGGWVFDLDVYAENLPASALPAGFSHQMSTSMSLLEDLVGRLTKEDDADVANG